jgi:hypothetical protein
MDDQYKVINWWQYNIESKKVINDITGEELIY